MYDSPEQGRLAAGEMASLAGELRVEAQVRAEALLDAGDRAGARAMMDALGAQARRLEARAAELAGASTGPRGRNR